VGIGVELEGGGGWRFMQCGVGDSAVGMGSGETRGATASRARETLLRFIDDEGSFSSAGTWESYGASRVNSR
jgi:hypothetical protein